MRYTASMAETKDLLVRNFPPDVKEALVALADERDTNMNDVAVELLAEEFGVPYTPRRRRAVPPGDSGDVVLRMPAKLKQKLRTASYRRDEPMAAIVLESLRAKLDGSVPALAER
jgi:transposase-like protein